jgi:predicted PurR-regulated permease PerM
MTSQNTNHSVYDTTIRLFFLFIIIVWCLMILYPFVSIMLWGLIFSLAFVPLHSALAMRLGGKPRLASFIIVLVSLAIIIVPSWFLLDAIGEELKEFKSSFHSGSPTIPPPSEHVKSWPIVGDPLYGIWQSVSVNIEQTIANYKEPLVDIGRRLADGVASAAGGVFQIMVSLIIAGLLLLSDGAGQSIRKFFRKLVGDRGDEFADITKKTIGNVVRGVLGVALIQTTLVGIGFLLAGVPYAGLWTLVVFVFAVLQLPVIFAVIPVAVYLFSEKEMLPAILWSVYLLLCGISDNIFKPILLGKGSPVPMLVIFVGVVGGFIFSGFIGLFTGAVVMSLGYKLFVGWINSPSQADRT